MASYTLHIQYVDRPAETRTFSQPKIVIGRDAGDIVLHDSQVSGRHAEITWDGTTLKFTDLGSTNGSFLLQGQRVANLELTPGIALRLGNSLITVQAIEGVAAGKGRTVIAGPGMVPGFPAPMKNPPPRPPGPPAPGNFAFAPTAQAPSPLLRPPQPGGAAPGGLSFTPAPPQPAPAPGGLPFAPPPQQPIPAPMPPAPMAGPMPAAPQPPGPPPGTLAPPQPAAPAPAPGAPVAAAPVAAAPAPAPVAAAESAAVQPAAPAEPAVPGTPAPAAGGAAASGDLGAQIKDILGRAWATLQPVAVPAVATLAAVLVPLGLLYQLGFMILPTGLAGLLGLLINLAQLAAMIILFPSVARFLLGSHIGKPIPIQTAVNQSIQKAADVAVHCAVASIPLGVFVPSIYYVEDKKIGASIGRNFNLLAKELVPILVSIFAFGFAFAIGSGIVVYIFTLLPAGAILASVVSNTLTAFAMAYMSALGVSQYFAVRRKHEGGDPEGEARARLGAAEAALPAA